MKIPNVRDSVCQRWGDLWMLLHRAKRIRCLVPLAHNGSGAGTEFAKKLWGYNPLLFAFRWRYIVFTQP